MASFFESLDEKQMQFIARQKIFFTSSAPKEGRINLSPKGMDTFRCLDPQRVAYLDLTGSGNETAAHLAENGRMTIMFCSFAKEPRILRLYGQGTVVKPGDAEWHNLSPLFKLLPGTRQIIVLQITSLQTSCGFAVPLAADMSERNTLVQWAEKKGTQGVAEYQQLNNQKSIDGLPTFLS